jgi:hypothetical protein
MSIKYNRRKSKSRDDSNLPTYNLPDFEVRASDSDLSYERADIDISKPSTKLNDDIKSMVSKNKTKSPSSDTSVADFTSIFDTEKISRKELNGSPFKRKQLS